MNDREIIDAQVKSITNALEALVRVKEASKPFAALLQDHHDDKADDEPLFGVNGKYITYGDLRELKRALKKVS
jgi:hypothetical protein